MEILLKFGTQLMNYFTTWEESLSAIKCVDAGPWSSLWWSDHFLPPYPRANLEFPLKSFIIIFTSIYIRN